MNFGFTEEQELLREQVQRFVERRCPMPQVRKWAASEAGFDRACFGEMAELGWTGLLTPEAHGGAGLGWVEAALVLEVTGGALLPGPLSSTLLASAAIAEHGSDAQRARWLPALASGERIGTVALLEDDGALDVAGVALAAAGPGASRVASGHKSHVHDAAAADLFVTALRVDGELALCVLERGAAGLSTQDHALIDRTKRVGSLQLDSVAIAEDAILCRGAEAEAAYGRLFDQGAVLTTAEMIGAADAVHALTVSYAKERIQFGRPIGQYQAVKHPLAEMFVDITTFRSLLYHAAWLVDGDPAALPRAASMAKAYASDAFARIGIDAIQLHGAIGYTAEYDAQLYLKRSKFARPAFGDSDYHYARVAQLGGL